MRIVSLLLLMVSLVIAESQEELYYRALKAEETGDYSLALNLFEAAIKEGGEYTAEIQEIVDDYRNALGYGDADSLDDDTANPWEFHTGGILGLQGIHYRSKGASTGEMGAKITSSISASAEYNAKDWIHSFELNLSGNRVDNDDLQTLTMNAWDASVGVEYSLVGKSLVLDVGADLNVSENDDWNPDFFVWVEKFFARIGKHKFGASLSAFDYLDGPLYATTYLSWQRHVKYGWRASLYAGGRFEADTLGNSTWVYWLGPSVKPTFSFRFRSDISIEAKGHYFYGYVVDGPDSKFEKVKKLSVSWASTLAWNPGVFGLYIGAEQYYRHYDTIPIKYSFPYPRWSFLTELKAGVKCNI